MLGLLYTCIRRHVSVDIYVSGYKLLVRDTCFQGHVSWFKLGITPVSNIADKPELSVGHIFVT